MRRLTLRLRRAVPALVWLGAIAVVIQLGTLLPGPATFPGIVDTAQGTVTAPVAGRIAAILVSLHEETSPDQVVARLDDTEVRLRLTQASYELERLRADLLLEEADRAALARTAAAEQGLETGAEQRRLMTAVEAAQLAALTTRTQLEEARVRVQGAAIESDRLQALARQGIVGEPEVVRASTERDALQKRIAELEVLHGEELARVAAANQRLREFTPPAAPALPVETALAPMRWRLRAQEAALERIVADSQLLVLRSPIRGRVVQVAAAKGEWVPAGRALITMADATPRRILAYVPDALRSHLDSSKTTCTVHRDSTLLGTTAIQSVSPSVIDVPERLRADPRVPEWAFEVVVSATGLERPGERVLLSLAP